MTELRQKAVSGAFWSAIEVVGQQTIGILISIVIARHLSPADYGLVGMIAIFLAMGSVLIDVGFPSALIRKQNVEPIEYDSVFYFNIVLSTILYAILFFASGLIARFFATPAIEHVSQVLFFTIILNAASMVHRIVATKALNFRTQSVVSMVSTVVSGCVGLWLVFRSYGYWALVAQQVVYAALRSILLWTLIPWSPRLRFSFLALRRMMGFSFKLLLSGLLDTIFTNFYGLFIGKVLGQVSLGYYAQAEKFRNAPLGALNSIVQRVSFPVLSNLQGDIIRLKAGYRTLLRMVAFITFPILLFLAMVAPELFRTVLTKKWQPSVELFQLLCVAGLGWGVSALSLNILQVKGRSDLYLMLEVTKKFVVVAVFAFFCWHGMIWMVRGVVISTFFNVFLNLHFAGKQISCSLWEQMGDMAPYLGIALLGVGAGWIASRSMNGILQLLVEGGVSAGTMLLLCWITRMEAFFYSINILTSKTGLMRKYK